jgi:hypothetical protein
MSRNPIIEISYAGHIGGTIKSISSSEEITKRIRKQVSIIKGCPISRKCTTKITEKSFREMCAIFQKRAGLLGKKTAGYKPYVDQDTGFQASNRAV